MTNVDNVIRETVCSFLGFESDSDSDSESEEGIPQAEIEEEETESEVYFTVSETVEEFFGSDSDDESGDDDAVLIQTRNPASYRGMNNNASTNGDVPATSTQPQTSRFRRIIRCMTRAMRKMICCYR